MDLKSYVDVLHNISGLHKDELRELIKEDMTRRGISTSSLDKYFSEVLITIQKRDRKIAGSDSGANIYSMFKREGCLLFKFDDSMSRLFRGFTIDLRVFFNLVRKMTIIKLNSDKIWTRQFYSQDLKKVFVVLKPLDSVIENRAMVMKIITIGRGLS